ncbi:leucyl aminopeptidase [Jatrophihabitans sp.]|uniref:leucyl aminopeptidase n=1 Tax=Jatrophihabitans sp. TaxID=1932789 RepID=UPI0030C6F40E|nr:leucyl aminopeptidase [Jatrophihabitans sp.]
MVKVSLVAPTAPLAGDAVVIGLLRSPDGPRLAPGAAPVDAALGGKLLAALKTAGASGKADEVVKVPTLGLAPFPLVVSAGLGTDGSAEALRRGVGAALRGLTGKRHVHLAIDGPLDALAEGAQLGAYAFTEYKSKATKPALAKVTIAAASDATARAHLKHAQAVSDAVLFVRDLVNTPPNDLYPATFAERAVARASAAGLEVEVLDERGLKRGRFGGILAVGGGSARGPRLVRITYRPAKPQAKVALVGKGITFDSGGLNIKTANMHWMKSDMGGAAAVIASVLAIAALKIPVEVTATVPMAENMPSGTAYRPSDVLTMRNGRTVEVADTDAEGRLVLADAVIRAVEDEPDYLIEASTLTGAQLVALGTRVIGAMGEPVWRDQVTAAGNAAGEAVWAMPIPAELRPALDSPIADLQSLTGDRWGGMLVGAAFIGDFVPEGIPWVHLDIAGPAWNLGGPHGYTPKGGTGAAVRTITAAVAGLVS